MSAHTRGQWIVPDGGWQPTICTADGGWLIARVTDTGAEAEANAALIAAAPDMLAALFLFADLPTDTPPPGITPTAWQAALDAAQAAIAKAEGR